MLNLFANSKLTAEEKIKEKYDRLKKIKIAKDNAKTEYKEAVMDNKQKLLPKTMKIKELKNELKEPQKRKRLSNILVFVSFVLTIITTCVSISGGFEKYSNVFGQSTFISFIVGTQFMILFISGIKPYLMSKNLIVYLNVSSAMQVFLLFVSISYNFVFLYSSENSMYWVVVTLVLCTIFDMSILLIMSISISIRFNYKGNQKLSSSLLSRILRLVTQIINNKLTNIENKVKKNAQNVDKNDNLNSDIVTNNNNNDIIETSQNDGYNSIRDLNLVTATKEDIKKYVDYAIKNKDNSNFLPSYKKIAENTNISRNKAYEIKKHLDKIGKTKVVGRSTKLA